MTGTSLQDITRQNWRNCINLRVADSQIGWVASNAVSLANAAYEPEWIPKAVYDGETMVGFVMYGNKHFKGREVWAILRLMVDEQHQRKGYGRAALQLTLATMREENPNIEDVYISFIPENDAARQLYRAVGFKEAGMIPSGTEALMHRLLGED